MKKRSIQRDVQVKAKVNQKSSEDFDLGRIPKMSHSRALRGRRKSPEEDLSDLDVHPFMKGAYKRLPHPTFIFLMAVVLVILAGAFIMWVNPRMSERVGTASPVLIPEQQLHREVPVLTEEEAAAMVRKVMHLRDPGKVNELLLLGTATPKEAIEFFTSYEQKNGAAFEIRLLGVNLDSDGKPVQNLLVRYSGENSEASRFAFLVPDEDQKWKFDYESFARPMNPGWEDLFSGKVNSVMARINLTKATYYNSFFSNEGEWVCYSFTAREEDDTSSMCYVKIGSPQAKALDEIFLSGQSMIPVYLELTKLPETEKRQFQVTRVLSSDWIMRGAAYDERFR